MSTNEIFEFSDSETSSEDSYMSSDVCETDEEPNRKKLKKSEETYHGQVEKVRLVEILNKENTTVDEKVGELKLMLSSLGIEVVEN
jgi:hypothetical protein